MNENENQTPTAVLDPIMSLLRSRAFWVMIATALAGVVVSLIPGLADQRDNLINVIVALGLLVIGKIGAEDVAHTIADGKVEAARHQANATVANAEISAQTAREGNSSAQTIVNNAPTGSTAVVGGSG